jgi:hypothetical protein
MPNFDLLVKRAGEFPFSEASLTIDGHVFYLFHSSIPSVAMDQIFATKVQSLFREGQAKHLWGSLIVGSCPSLSQGEIQRAIPINGFSEKTAEFRYTEFQFPLTVASQSMRHSREEKALQVMLKNFSPKSAFDLKIHRLASDLINQEDSALRNMFLQALNQTLDRPNEDFHDDLKKIWVPIITALIYRKPTTFLIKPSYVGLAELWRAFHLTKIYLACAGAGRDFIWDCNAPKPFSRLERRRSRRSSSQIFPVHRCSAARAVIVNSHSILGKIAPFVNVTWNRSGPQFAYNNETQVLVGFIGHVGVTRAQVSAVFHEQLGIELTLTDAGIEAKSEDGDKSMLFSDLLSLTLSDLGDYESQRKLRALSNVYFKGVFPGLGRPVNLQLDLLPLMVSWLKTFDNMRLNQSTFIVYLGALVDALYVGMGLGSGVFDAQATLYRLIYKCFEQPDVSTVFFGRFQAYMAHFYHWMKHTYVLGDTHVLHNFFKAWQWVVRQPSIQWFLTYKLLIPPKLFQDDGYMLPRLHDRSGYWLGLKGVDNDEFVAKCAHSSAIVTLYHQMCDAINQQQVTSDQALQDLLHMACLQSHFDRCKEVLIVWYLIAAKNHITPSQVIVYLKAVLSGSESSLDDVEAMRGLIDGQLKKHDAQVEDDIEEACFDPLMTTFFVRFLRLIAEMDASQFHQIRHSMHLLSRRDHEREDFELTDWMIFFADLDTRILKCLHPGDSYRFALKNLAAQIIFERSTHISARHARMPLCWDKFIYRGFALLAADKNNRPLNHAAKCMVTFALGMFVTGLLVPAQLKQGGPGNSTTVTVYPQIFYWDDVNKQIVFLSVMFAKDVIAGIIAIKTKQRNTPAIRVYHIVDVAVALGCLLAGSDLAFFEMSTLLNDVLFYYGELYYALAFFKYHEEISDALAKAIGIPIVGMLQKLCCNKHALYAGHDIRDDHFVARLHQVVYHTLFYLVNAVLVSLAAFAAFNPFANVMHDMGNNFSHWLSRFVFKLSGNTLSVLASPLFATLAGFYVFLNGLYHRYHPAKRQWAGIAASMVPAGGALALKAYELVEPTAAAVIAHNQSGDKSAVDSSLVDEALSTMPPLPANHSDGAAIDSSLWVWLALLAALLCMAAVVVFFEKILSAVLPKPYYPKTVPRCCLSGGPAKRSAGYGSLRSQLLGASPQRATYAGNQKVARLEPIEGGFGEAKKYALVFNS